MSLKTAFKGKIVKEKSISPWKEGEQAIYILKEKTRFGWKMLIVCPGFHKNLFAGSFVDLPDSFLTEYTDIYD